MNLKPVTQFLLVQERVCRRLQVLLTAENVSKDTSLISRRSSVSRTYIPEDFIRSRMMRHAGLGGRGISITTGISMRRSLCIKNCWSS